MMEELMLNMTSNLVVINYHVGKCRVQISRVTCLLVFFLIILSLPSIFLQRDVNFIDFLLYTESCVTKLATWLCVRIYWQRTLSGRCIYCLYQYLMYILPRIISGTCVQRMCCGGAQAASTHVRTHLWAWRDAESWANGANWRVQGKGSVLRRSYFHIRECPIWSTDATW